MIPEFLTKLIPKHWKAILTGLGVLLLLLIGVAAASHYWGLVRDAEKATQEAKDAKASKEKAEKDLKVSQAQTQLNKDALTVTERIIERDRVIRVEVQNAQDSINQVPEASETLSPELDTAWRDAINRLRKSVDEQAASDSSATPVDTRPE